LVGYEIYHHDKIWTGRGLRNFTLERRRGAREEDCLENTKTVQVF
jgi:hypothetical protein